ncbi:proliferation marker protein Ki-67 isoform X1 [Tachysurus vachellii]|uniref:proliferation marker protein Ki-67 isoform X1 n=2 Tax=Tachysurus vachellii TaxID=175792 RepID=UPI00296ABB88|nr:proliferation marker protein Ki-67 isoform X1 [Tachysurus vachellii]
MPLLGKIVVIKRNGTDGTEFPLTASCLFGRKLDCDIRIQLPQVSKEHCRIEFNENKELILTNLSSVNPTRINGEVLQQSERLKHGDLITIIDRSFRFEYPPAPTPKKKRLSTPGKGETVKVLQDQQVKSTPGTTEKSEHTTDTCLKDGSNLLVCMDQSNGDQQSKASMDSNLSPFSDLYNMVKRDLATKPVWKSSSLSNTPLSRPSVDKQEIEEVSSENVKPMTPKSAQKKRRSSTVKSLEGVQTENLSAEVKTATPVVQGMQVRHSEGISMPVSQKKTSHTTPQKFTADQVAQQIAFKSPSTKSPKARRSSTSQTPEKQTIFQNPSELEESEEVKVKQATRTSPRANAGKRFQVQDVLEAVATPTSDGAAGNGQPSSKKHKCDDLPLPVPKRKRVSFGGQLSPELFDKGLPPNSPLRRGATPGRRSLGFTQKSHSLLRRASTIGLMGYQLEEDIAESPAKNRSPKQASSPAKGLKTPSPAKGLKTPSPAKGLKTPSPAKGLKTPSPAKGLKTPSPARGLKTPSPARGLKTPSPARGLKTPSPARGLKTPSTAKKSPSPKDKTLSPKYSKTPLPSSNSPTPKSSRRQSNASVKSPFPSEELLLKTPTTHGRFSVSRISTPSPDSVHRKETKEESVPVVEDPWKCVTPRATLRRSGMKASARKTPKSVLKSALDVVRSRRSGASRANLKVVSSWADIVKFGQAKPQMDFGTKKTANKRTAVKQTKVTKPKTPAHRLIDHTSTGHADSPASIVVGKAYLRSTKLVGAAPKVVCNVALFKKDLKMDEDLTGVSDIFKTPANSRRKSAFTKTNVCPATPLVGEMTEISVMNTPEETGEMVVSPMTVVSTAKLGRYNSEAVSRLLQDDQDGSLIEEMDDLVVLCPSEVSTVLDMPSKNQTKSKKAVPVGTPQHKPTPKECLTGVKRLMRTPKQKAEPIEDLRGKLLKTPKEPKLLQEVSFEGVKELLNTPEQKGTPLAEELTGLKRLKTPKVTINSPVVCAVALKRLTKTLMDKTEQEEDLTGVKQLMKTPKQKEDLVEEDLTGIQEMMITPKQNYQLIEPKKQPIREDLTGIQQMMKTPKLKKKPVEEDLTGVKQMMKTPKLKKQQVEEDLTGVKQMMKTPKLKKQQVEEDLTGIQEMMKTPKQKNQLIEQKKQPIKEDITGIQQMMKTPKLKIKPVEEDLTGVKQMMKTPKLKKQPVEEDLTGIQEMMKTPKNLVGVKSLFQTPKKKGEPVENDFGIDNLMKTPTQKNGVIEDSVIVEDLENCSSGALLVEDACMKSKGKANICLDGDVKNDTEEAETSFQEVKEEQTNVSTSAKKTRCGARVRMAQKSQKIQHQVDSDSLPAAAAGVQEETTADSAKSVSTLRGRRGKLVIEVFENVLVQSPAGKSNKGRNTEEQVEAPKSSHTSAGDEQVALKPRRGRKVEQDVEDLQVDPVISMKSPAPVRGKRGRKGKHVSENPQEPEPLVEASVEEVGVASKSAELQPSAETEAPVKTITRTRRGRKEPTVAVEKETSDTKSADAVVVESVAENTRRVRSTKKELLKTSQVMESLETTPIVVESDYVDSKLPKSTEAQLAAETKDPVKANSKPRRGRPTKKEIPVRAQVEEISKHSLDSEVLPDEHTEVPVKSRRGRKVSPVALAPTEAPTVKSGRGARNKRLKPQAEDAPNHAKYVITTAAPTEEPAEKPVVINVRRGRMPKCPKAQVLDDSQEEAQDTPRIDLEPVQQLEAPTVRSARRKCTATVEDEPEAPVKRGRRAATVEVPPPAVKSSRSRKAAAKSEPEEVTADATIMVEPVKETGNETKVLVSVTNETPLTQADSGVVAKGGRGRITKKAKVSIKNTSVNEAEETAVEEPQLKKKDEATDKEDPSVAEIKISVKGRKGRGAKKQEDLEMEKTAAEENTLPVRRGRAAASVLSQNKEVAACPKRGQKRKDMETVAEETVDTESLPKRKRGKGAGAETETVTAVTSKGRKTAAKKAEETSEVEAEEALKKGEKPVRGRRKVTLEDVPPQAEDPVPETATRRGTRGQKKAEANVPTAPVRRSRRK